MQACSTVAARYWDQALRAETPKRVRWWEDESTCRHINKIVCGESLEGLHKGFHNRLSGLLADASARRAISVGCGTGGKEWDLLRRGVVQHFDLYDISSANIQAGQEQAKALGLSDRVSYHLADAFQSSVQGNYDLVYWNNALHHMFDVDKAVSWSAERLMPGGIFAMDDFVGPRRFQWTDENLRWASEVRGALPTRLLRNAWAPGELVRRVVERGSIEELIATDPSEAADSDRIIEAIKRTFAHPEIKFTGGALYHLALNDILWNFRSEDDLVILHHILMLDLLLAENGTTHYAVAFARK
jgi:SAM-dependent methyltransferase